MRVDGWPDDWLLGFCIYSTRAAPKNSLQIILQALATDSGAKSIKKAQKPTELLAGVGGDDFVCAGFFAGRVTVR